MDCVNSHKKSTYDNSTAQEIISLLECPEKYTFTGSESIQYDEAPAIEPNDTVMFQIDRITFEDEAPWKEALENVLSAVRIPDVNFVYCILGDASGVKFYYGLARKNGKNYSGDLSPAIPEYGTNVLQASLSGNYRGSSIRELSAAEKDDVIEKIVLMQNHHVSRIEGVAGSAKDDERFQSVDRLVDVMQGDQFCVLIIASAMEQMEIAQAERSISEAYEKLYSDMKFSLQDGTSSGTSESKSTSVGTSDTHTTGKSSGESTNKSSGKSTTDGTSEQSGPQGKSTTTSHSGSESSGEDKGKNTGTSESDAHGTSNNESIQAGTNQGISNTVSREYIHKCIQDWLQYCDDTVFKRLDQGRGKGLFHTAFYVMSQSLSVQRKLENTVLSLYNGREANRVPLLARPLQQEERQRGYITSFQIPMISFKEEVSESEILARSLLAQQVSNYASFPLSNWMTTNELSMIAGLPRKEVPGLRVREEVEFGLNLPEKENDDIVLGSLVKDGIPMEKRNDKGELLTPVYLKRSSLDKHIFVAGVTGSGKTTTCQSILMKSNLPFLVIEPVKTEYRAMSGSEKFGDVLVFTLGNDDVAPFRLNPLEFLPSEGISAHIDMLKASFEAAFQMDAAIPQIVEKMLHKCYADKGWDTDNNENSNYASKDAAFASGECSFPTLSDLMETIDPVVESMGFDERLYKEYAGTIRALFQSLLLGGKGQMLNCARSISFSSLLEKQVVLELESIKSGNEKSFIMGIILSNFNEAVRERYEREKHNPEKRGPSHILLVEEAHRLLSKWQQGESLNKKQGVEIFTDMLAEIRKYGECLIIADQIPNKLADDVLKNTNTKIIHRIFAQDDKEAVGNTMALNDNQKRYLSSLERGRAILFSDGYEEAVQVAVEKKTDTSDNAEEDSALRNRAFSYYYSSNSTLFIPLTRPYAELSPDELETIIPFVSKNTPVKELMRSLELKKSILPGGGLNSESDAIFVAGGVSASKRKEIRTVLEKGVVSEDAMTTWIAQQLFGNRTKGKEMASACVKYWMKPDIIKQ